VHAINQVLSLRPRLQGEFAGELTVTVQSNDCDQLGDVLRAPAVATRRGEAPPDVTVPDPAVIPAVPENPPAPTVVPSGPHR
jgi:serine/threonine-protein kinase